MNIFLSIGTIIFAGYILGELAERIKLPKITGYIFAGILLNPDLFGILSDSFVEHTDPLLSISLSFITFSIGGTLSISGLKKTGKSIVILTLSEALMAFFSVFILLFVAFYFIVPDINSTLVILALSLILASLAAPTDPSAALAVKHEYHASGEVSSTILEIAALDDIVAIVLYTLISALGTLLMGQDVGIMHVLAELGMDVGGAILVGLGMGLLFSLIVKLFKHQSEGSLIVITFGLLVLSYGISDYLGFEALLTTMTLGMIVVNFNPLSDQIFKLIDRYTDELIFVIFFTISGLHLQLDSISGSVILILLFVAGRFIGKFSGIYFGSRMTHASKAVRKNVAGGLIPQGGIVIGLALVLSRQEIFKESSSMIVGIVIGAALIHEIIGPILSRMALKRAGEIK